MEDNADTRELFDPAIGSFLSLVAEGRTQMSITITVDGMIISGMVVSFREFLGGVEDGFASVGTELTVHFSQRLQGFLERMGSDMIPHNALYLRDVTVWAPGGVRSLRWWACRLDAISGWWIESSQVLSE